jgi:hypothetical protein
LSLIGGVIQLMGTAWLDAPTWLVLVKRYKASYQPARRMPSCPTELSRGGLPVEEVKAQVALNEKRSGSVGDYDPVLRAHCRLDREG